MIKELLLQNFKAFEKENFELGTLNLLSGLNNTGKSSVIQSLRLLSEKKPLPELGPLLEYIRNDMKEFRISGRQIEKGTVCFSYTRDGKTKQSGNMEGIISYISADRFGPRNSLPLNIDNKVTVVGSKGENIVDFLSQIENEWIGLQVPDKLIVHEGSSVRQNIIDWLRVISPGVSYEYFSDHHADIGRTMFNHHRPVHAGFGLSYTLPIIASVLLHTAQLTSMENEPVKTDSVLLLLENPEAHLHPSGQTKMGEMLARAASCGVQIVTETHSDHLLNGVRIAVKDNLIPHTDIGCFFFNTGKNEEPPMVNHISIDKYGMLDYWPDGFFDETEKSLMRLV
jgi:predicted ATPase